MLSERGQEATLAESSSSNSELEELAPSTSCRTRLKVSAREDGNIDTPRGRFFEAQQSVQQGMSEHSDKHLE